MASFAVVEDFDVVEDLGAELGLGWPGAAVDQLLLQGREEALGDGVIEAVAFASHRLRDAGGAGLLSEREADEYTSMLCGRTLKDAGIVQSMGKVGDPWDNAMMESAIGTVKAELVDRHVFRSKDQARLAVFDYIESFYNPIRSHSALGYLSPDEHEAAYHQRQKEEAPQQLAEAA